MVELIREKVCAEPGDGIVVFLIGMRINKFWKVWRWLPVFLAMPAMLRELAAQPELGMLSATARLGWRNQTVLQYWKSAAHLQAYAHAAGRAHLPAWQAFSRRIGTGGDVGIWHETYVVPPGHAESVYMNMPRHGLGAVAPLFPATGRRASAAKRLAGANSASQA